MAYLTKIMSNQSHPKVTRAPRIEPIWIGLALQYIYVYEAPHHLNVARRVVACSNCMAGETSPPSPRLRRGSLRVALRCERRLEVRGFEPLAFSLRTRRSTN